MAFRGLVLLRTWLLGLVEFDDTQTPVSCIEYLETLEQEWFRLRILIEFRKALTEKTLRHSVPVPARLSVLTQVIGRS